MFLLSVSVLLNWQLFAMKPEDKVKNLVETYFSQIHKAELEKKLIFDEFKDIWKTDQKIFKICASRTCQPVVKVSSVKNRPQTWRVNLQVQYSENKKNKIISLRPGCYVVVDFKLKTYLEDCEPN